MKRGWVRDWLVGPAIAALVSTVIAVLVSNLITGKRLSDLRQYIEVRFERVETNVTQIDNRTKNVASQSTTVRGDMKGSNITQVQGPKGPDLRDTSPEIVHSTNRVIEGETILKRMREECPGEKDEQASSDLNNAYSMWVNSTYQELLKIGPKAAMKFGVQDEPATGVYMGCQRWSHSIFNLQRRTRNLKEIVADMTP